MTLHRRALRPLWLSFVPAITLSAAAAASGDAAQSGLSNFDTFLGEIAARHIAAPGGLDGRAQKTIFDAQLGKPTVLWATQSETPIAVGPLSSEQEKLAAMARQYLREHAAALGLSSVTIDNAAVSFASYNGSGGAVVRLRQRVNGHEVFHRYLNVTLDRNDRPVGITGYFADDGTASKAFPLGAAQAIVKAMANMGGALDLAALKPAKIAGEYQWFEVPAVPSSSNWSFDRGPRARKIYYARASGLEPAFYVELMTRGKADRTLDGYAFVVSANTGAILHRESLMAHADAPAAGTAFSYRVYASPAAPYTPDDSPLGNGNTPSPTLDITGKVDRKSAKSQLISIVGLNKPADPWLPADAKETLGNHVDACIDNVDTPVSGVASNPANICTPELGDQRAATTSANTFDYEAQGDADPSTDAAKNAAVVEMFYLTNWLHDIWYDYGFDERAGNAQTSNYGRGGEEGDPLLAQGQDASGRNNANMSTPADGSSPTMQQYLFNGKIIGEVKQTAPSGGTPLRFGVASFGPTTFNLTGELKLINDQAGDSTTDGCGASATTPEVPDVTGEDLGLAGVPVSTPGVPDPSLNGAIALIDRGTCNFSVKEQYAQMSGAAALIVVNNTDGEPFTMGNADVPVGPSVTDDVYQVPAVMIRKADGDALKALLKAGAVTMHVERDATVDFDGTRDNQIVAHEYFHYVHHRLTDSSNQQANAMSEGWGDTDALVLSARKDDTNALDNAQWQGAYGLAGYVVDNFFLGIRRAPYSTDMKKNAFTFKHLSNGEKTPDGGTGATNSEVHSGGEIWANMMWECYAGLLNHYPFETAQDHMRSIIIGGLKATPADATYVEARDAVLMATKTLSNDDFILCGNGFAKRGAGPKAVAPARDSSDLKGITEDFTPYGTVESGGTTGDTTGSTTGDTTGSTGSTTGSTAGGTTGNTTGGTTGDTTGGGTGGTTGSTIGGGTGGTTGGTTGGSTGGTTGGAAGGTSGASHDGNGGGALGLGLLGMLASLGALRRRRRY